LLPPEGQLVPAYPGPPYLTETEGYNPEYESIWYSFDALDPRRGMSEEYGKRQWEAIIGACAEVVADLLALG
jgi:hypothetical protein